MKNRLFLALSVVAALTVTAFAADAVKLDGVKCLVNPKAAAKEGKSVDYKGGKVYFCCDNCPKAFAKDTAKFATAANQQLVTTGQAKQVACPIAGKDIDPSTKLTVNGTDVCFCCNNCKGKVEAAKTPEEAAELVFSDAAFAKGFKVAK